MLRFLFCIVLLTPVQALATESWPQFRGPGGQGITSVTGLPLQWSETENVVWKCPIPGRGWSSPVVMGDSIWLTTAIETAASESQKQNLLSDRKMASQLDVAQSITLQAIEIDLSSGRITTDVDLFHVDSPQAIHSLNSFASPTPILDTDRLYCHFGAFGTACVDTQSGEIDWRRTIALEHKVGPGSSPVGYEHLLVLTCDGADRQFVEALDKQNGETVWQTERPPIRAEDGDYRKSFSTPLLIHAAGRDQLVIPGSQWFISYNPRTGEEIWRVDHGDGFSLAPRPVFDGNHVFLCTGFMQSELWAIRPDGEGDVTQSHFVWKKTKQIPTMPSPLLVGPSILVISDQGIATRFDAATGEQLWRERIPGNYSASPLLAEGRVYLCNHEGRTTVLDATDFQLLAQNDLDGQIMASPVVVDNGDLLLRTESHLYRVGN